MPIQGRQSRWFPVQLMLALAALILADAQRGMPLAGGAVVVDPQSFGVDENVTRDIGTVSASAKRKGETLTFAIANDPTGGAFAIDPVTAVLSVVRALDHEASASHVLTVSATDSRGMVGSAEITVNVGDVNETPQITSTTLSVDEKRPIGTLVGVVPAIDPDRSSPYGDLSYALTPESVEAPFELDTVLGLITTKESFDAAIAGSYSLGIEITDGGGLRIIAALTILVVDVNEAPTLSPASFTVEENQYAGAFVGALSAADPDPTAPNNTISFAIISGNESRSFWISPESGRIETAAILDFEQTSSYALTVSAEDGGGLSATVTIVIDVVDGTEPDLPRPPAYIADIDGTNGAVISGNVAEDYMGENLGRLGDINGDGYADFSIGSELAHVNGEPNIGKFHILFGGSESIGATVVMADYLFDGSFGAIVSGSNATIKNYRLRGGIGVGDADNDGIDDLIANDSRDGGIYLITGKTGVWDNIDIAQFYLNNNQDGLLGTFFGLGSSDYPLRTGSGVGDLDADGISDLGFYFRDWWSPFDTKSAVLYGRDGGFGAYAPQDETFDTLDQTRGLWVDGTDPVSDPVHPLNAAGDFNGDGFDDFLVAGEWGDPNGLTNAGHVFIVFGQPDRMVQEILLPSLDGVNGVVVNGAIEGDQIGFLGQAAPLGDVNGDGYGDIIIGAPRSDSIFPGGGRAFVIFGRQTSVSAEIDVSALDGFNGFAIDPGGHVDRLGQAVAGAGDVNGDGYDDILLGAPNGYDPLSGGLGQSYLIYGGPAGRFPPAISVLALDGTNGSVFTGLPEYFHAFGGTVTGVGDVNGDGFDDILVADHAADPNGLVDAGEAYLVYGANFTGAVTNIGGAGDDHLAGSDMADVMIGGRGNDVLLGGHGADVLKGGHGDDVLVVADLGFRQLDGGSGTDILRLNGGGLFLDLIGDMRHRLRNLEIIDLTGSGDNTVVLNRIAVVALSSETNTIKIRGDSGDIAAIGSGWIQQSQVVDGGVTYRVYDWGQTQARLLIEEAVTAQGPL